MLLCWSGTQTTTYVVHGRFVTGFQNIAKERGIKKQGAALRQETTTRLNNNRRFGEKFALLKESFN